MLNSQRIYVVTSRVGKPWKNDDISLVVILIKALRLPI